MYFYNTNTKTKHDNFFNILPDKVKKINGKSVCINFNCMELLKFNYNKTSYYFI